MRTGSVHFDLRGLGGLGGLDARLRGTAKSTGEHRFPIHAPMTHERFFPGYLWGYPRTVIVHVR